MNREQSDADVMPATTTGSAVVPESRDATKSRLGAQESGALHQVVVVGGGAAGLELVTRLGDTLAKRKQIEATLIERSRAHLWKPLLHEVAAGSMDIGHHAIDY